MSFVYLANPIDQSGKTPAGPGSSWKWKAEIIRISRDLAAAGHDVYRPAMAFRAGECGPKVQSVNSAALAAADGGVALLPAGVPTLGTPAEIERLLSAGKPVLIVTDLQRSAQLRDWEQRGVFVCAADRVEGGLMWLQHELTAPVSDALRPELVFQHVGYKVVAEAGGSGTLISDLPSKLPSRGYEGDAGLDLVVSQDTEVPGYAFVDIPCGVKADIPAGMFGLIVGRSSTLRKRGLLVTPGVIDEGWTGPLFAGVQNMLGDADYVKAGERVAQLLLLPALAAQFTPVWGTVPNKHRGERGFGSTGV